MDCYEKLVDYASNLGMEIIEKSFKSSAKGLCKGNKIGISKDLESSVEKRCILAEEMAHSLYTVGNILDLTNPGNLKQELYARKKAYEFLLPLSSLIAAYENGLKACYEIAEYLEVTEEFLTEALYHYQLKYGIYAKYGKYIIYFSPLIVCEKPSILAV